jgi:transposase-like protein
MYRGKRTYNHLSLATKQHIVLERLNGVMGVKRLAAFYQVSQKEIRLWTKRYRAGEPLKMKMGRPRKHPAEEPTTSEPTEPETPPERLRAENKQLKAELAYKNELIKLLENRARVKKKSGSNSSED